ELREALESAALVPVGIHRQHLHPLHHEPLAALQLHDHTRLHAALHGLARAVPGTLERGARQQHEERKKEPELHGAPSLPSISARNAPRIAPASAGRPARSSTFANPSVASTS